MTEISVPSGGGALAGIGETFQPDLHTGTGNMSVPLPLPPGRGAVTPSLALAYSSAAGNGPFGLGWTMAVPRVSRRTDRGVPVYDDAADVFVLSGSEELASVPPGNAIPADLPTGAVATRYRPRTESGFARIVHVVGPQDDYWDAWSGSGLRNRYGTARPAGAAADWVDPGSIRTPEGMVFSWLLTRTMDPLGNVVAYTYRGDGGAQRYLDTVSYADYGDPAAPSYAVTVTVGYDVARPDPFCQRRGGFELRTTLRASRIEITTVGQPDAPATVIELGYADQAGGGASAGGLSLLSSIRITGQDTGTGQTQSLPPLTFGYRPWEPEVRRFRRLPDTLPPTPLGSGLDLVDLFGHGLPSVLKLSGSAQYWRNRGGGQFDLARTMLAAPSGATLGTPGVQLGDVDADGRPELTVTAGGRTTVWPFTPPGPGSDQAGFEVTPQVSHAVPTTEPGNPQVRVLDLDGDHIPDLLLAGPHPLLARGDGHGGFERPQRIQGAPPLEDLADPHVHLADMTGDGLPDVVEIHDGAVRYWPNLGHGRFGPLVQMATAPRFADAAAYGSTGFDPRRLLLGDLTGDGTTDVVYVADGQITVWTNTAGNGFAPPVVVRGTPGVDDRSAVRLADVDGIGVSGVLWSGLGSRGEWAFLDLTGGAKPYLLTTVDNHRGAVTTMTWSTSTAYASADRVKGRRWRTPLPFPVHVIAGSRTVDVFAETVLTTGFQYSDGYWDPVDREFRGFGRVEQSDTLTPVQPAPPAPPLLTPLDPLTPAAPVPAGFDAEAQGNLLGNWSLDVPRGAGATTLSTSATQPQGSGDAAADGWTTWNGAAATTATQLVSSDLPQGQGGQMLHVTTDGAGCGVAQAFLPVGGGPSRAVASIWIKVVRGAVSLGTGNGTDVVADAVCDLLGSWVLVQVGNQRGPANRLVVLSASPGGAEFYVDHAWVRVDDVPAEPVGTPPVRTVTWFALGPVGRAAGDWTAVDPTDDYWAEDPPLRPHLDLSAFPSGLPRPALREALRAVRGRTLRTEIYADDGDPVRGQRPYEVHDAAFAVVPVLDGRTVTDPTWQARPVVTLRDVLSRQANWERGEEPMVRITASGGHDEYGRPHVVVEAGVARGRNPRGPGAPCLGTVTTTDYATRDDATLFLLERVARTARHELPDPGTGPVLDLLTATAGSAPAGKLLSLRLTYYDGPEFTGLGLGLLGDHGLPVRAEELVLTPERLAQIAAPVVAGGSAGTLPPYLSVDGSPAAGTWPAPYPATFRDAVMQAPAERGVHLGYVWHDASGPVAAGYYAQTSRSRYDFHTPVGGRRPRGLLLVGRDAWGSDTTTVWDSYDLFPATTTDSVGLISTVAHDYRVLKPALITDPNGIRTATGYTPLGLQAWTARTGRPGLSEGDTVDQPGVRYEYDLTATDRSVAAGGDVQPMSVSTLRRVDHRWTLVDTENARRAAAGQPPLTPEGTAAMFGPMEEQDHPERFVRVVQYSDGLSRLLQTRTQADQLSVSDVGLPGDLSFPTTTVVVDALTTASPVVVSGWKVYDQKGRTAVDFEPFRDFGWAYAPPSTARLAGLAAVRQYHDPRGRPTVTVAADGSRTRVVRGRPTDLADPGSALPTPWESWTYDAEDEAGRTHPTESLDSSARWNTPNTAVIDAFGRIVRTVQRAAGREINTTSEYDVDGRLISVTDPLGRTASASVYDMAGRPWAVWLLDGGTRRTVYNAAGTPTEHRDNKGALILTGFDSAHRATAVWAANGAGQTATLRQVTGYGDDGATSGLTPEQATAANSRGRVAVAYDEAGRVRTEAYDVDGNPTRTGRRVLRPALLLSGLPAAGSWAGAGYVVDWQPATGTTLSDRAAALLDEVDYTVDSTFDAMGRRTATTAPTDVTGRRAEITFDYARGGGVTLVKVDNEPHLQQVVYDALGRRSIALLANGVLLRYRYDARTHRLRRFRAEHATPTASGWACDGPVLQDSLSRHDRLGRVTTLSDRTPGSGIAPTPDVLDREFAYDGLGRLTSATGRETEVAPASPWIDGPRSTDVTRARRYTETYAYDVVGTMLSLAHATDVSGIGAYTRTFGSALGGNRLASITSGALTVGYTYDDAGNLLSEADNRIFEWDAADRLVTFRDQAGTSPPSVYAQYRYDGSGQRVVKIVRRNSGPDLVTIYVGGFERVLRGTVGTPVTVYDEVHLTDRDTRLVTLRRGPALPDDPFPDPVRYQLSDHLGSVTATLGSDGGVLNREEFTPYGETAFGSYAKKRYRFTGKERDEESGLAYHGARYYAPWLARWTAVDPAPRGGGRNEYAYAADDPVHLVDPDGRAEQPPATSPPTDQVKIRGGDPRVNARVGREGALGQDALLESKGMTIHDAEVPVKDGFLDKITSRAGAGLRSLEQKTMTMWKKDGHYRTESGELIVKNVDASLRRMIDQATKHVRGMAATAAEDATARLPRSENILITVRGPAHLVEQVRERAQALAASMETKVGETRIGIGVIGESATKGLTRRLGGTALSIGPGIALGFAADHVERDFLREGSIQGKGSAEDQAFMQSRGFSWTEEKGWVGAQSIGHFLGRGADVLTMFLGDPTWQLKLQPPPSPYGDMI